MIRRQGDYYNADYVQKSYMGGVNNAYMHSNYKCFRDKQYLIAGQPQLYKRKLFREKAYFIRFVIYGVKVLHVIII